MNQAPRLAALTGVLITGCHMDPLTDVPCADNPACIDAYAEVLTITPNLDLLVVVDDSPSMIEKQNAFRAAFPALLAQLATIKDGTPNLHLAVISPDLGTSAPDGEAAPIGVAGVGGCAAAGKGGVFQRGDATFTDGGRFATRSRDGAQNFEGELALAFGEMSSLGAGGCGFEQPLAAIDKALSGDLPENAGFVRPSANLAVLVLSDEDDCSAADTSLFGPDSAELGPIQSFRCFRFGVACDQDPATAGTKTNCKPAGTPHVSSPDPYADALLALKPDPRRVLFGGVVGKPDVAGQVEVVTRTQDVGPPQVALDAACRFVPANGTTEVTADPAIRLSAFADNFARSRVESICAADLTPAAQRLGDAIATMMNDTCIPVGITNPYACLVEDHRDADPAFRGFVYGCLPEGPGTGDCFHFAEDASCASGQRLAISRTTPLAGDAWSTLRCER